MTNLSIEATTDGDAKTGQRVLLLLRGQSSLPEGTMFRIEPATMGDEPSSPEGWPTGEHVPVEVRLLPEGVQLVLGPDVAGAAAIQAGSSVKFALSKGDLQGEFAWPAPATRKPAKLEPGAIDSDPVAPVKITPVEVIIAKVETVDRKPDEAALEAIAPRIETAAPQPPQAEKTKADMADTPTLSSLMVSGKSPGHLNGSPMQLPLPVRPNATLEASLRAAPDTLAKAPVKTEEKPRLSQPVVLARADMPVAKQVRTDARTQYSRPGRLMMALRSLPLLLTGAALGVIGTMIWFGMSTPGLVDAQRLEFARNIYPVVGDAFKAGAVSPRGRDARSVDLDAALRLAEANLLGIGQPVDRVEARYWLAKSLDYAVGDTRMVWALSQLGTLYANADGKEPDYTTARAVWLLAAGQGDALSMCFLATLHEKGLGTPVDPKAALALYERAQSHGGCSDSVAAIQRLRK